MRLKNTFLKFVGLFHVRLNAKNFLSILLLLCSISYAQQTVTAIGSPVVENFSSYSGTSTFPSNWTASGHTANYNGTNQTSGATGGWYGNTNMSFLGSGSASNGNATWRLQNNTGTTITGFSVSFEARMWKSGTASPVVSLTYGTNSTGTVPTAGALTSILTFSDATTNIATGTTLSQTISSISIPNGNYIYIRFVHPGGSNSDNLGWDTVSFTPTAAPTAPEINIKQNTTDIASGGSYGFGNQTTGSSSSATTFTIENTGTGALNLTSTPKIILSGTNASEFSVSETAITSPVAASGTTTYTVTFSPVSDGSKTATLTIANNDSDEGSYVINLTGTGTPPPTVDYCNLQFPGSATINVGSTVDIYAKVYEAGVTNGPSQGAGITSWIGYSSSNSNPSTAGWTWIPATYNGSLVNDDEYKGVLGAGLSPGTYYYASRFQLSGGPYSYGGIKNDGTAGGFWDGSTNINGVLTVNDTRVDYANLQTPATGSILLGGAFNVYAQVYKAGVTTVPGVQGVGISAWIGYSTTNTNPNTASWTWVPATFNALGGGANNDEFMINLGASISTTGTYYYASRFQLGSGSYDYGGILADGSNGNFWNGSNYISGVLTVNTPQEINIKGNGVSIASGSSPAVASNHTDFGSVTIGATVVRTFTIENTGTLALSLSGTPRVAISGSSSFVVTTQPASASVAGNSSITFQITYTANAIVAENATVSISNNDADENPYTFVIKGIGTPSQLSDVVASSYTYNATRIDYTKYQSATITNTNGTGAAGGSVSLYKFDIRDGGGVTDADALPTILDGIVFNVTNSTMLRSAALFDGNSLVKTGTVGVGTITFTGLSTITDPSKVTAFDGGTTGLTLRVTFQATVTDNTQFVVTIPNTGVTTAASSSLFKAFTSVSSDIDGIKNRIDVVADRLAFVQQPSNTSINVAMAPSVTVSANDVNGNRDLDFVSAISITSTGTLAGSPVIATAISGLATFATLTHTAVGTGLKLTASRIGFSDVLSNDFVISNLTNGEFYSVPGSTAWNNDNSWQKVVGGVLAAAGSNSFPNTGNPVVYITTGTDMSTNGSRSVSKMVIQNGGKLTTTSGSGTIANLLVQSGGEFYMSNLYTFSTTLEVENNGSFYYMYNNTASRSTSIWAGTEKFHANSNFIIKSTQNSGGFLVIQDKDDIDELNGACFGNLIIDQSAGQLQLLPTGFSKTLTNGDLIFRNGSNDIRISDSPYTTTITGNLIIENTFANKVTVLSGGSNTANLTIVGNLSHSGSKALDLNATTGSTSVINLRGDLSIVSGALLNSTATSGTTFNFKGSYNTLAPATIQTIDIASIGATENANISFNVNAGSYTQLLNNDFQLGNTSNMTVSSGGTLDFGYNTAGTTPLTVTEVPAGATSTAFTLTAGGTLKITSPLGIPASGTGTASGNILLDSRTYGYPLSTFHYIGKANQQTGAGISSAANTKTVICDLATNLLQLTLTNPTAITSPGLLNIQKGQVIETAANYFSGSTGGLTMEAGTLYQIPVLTASATTAEYLPRFQTTSYTLNGGTIELNGNGAQTLRGGRSYRNIIFSNPSGDAVTKTISDGTPNVNGKITIANAVTVNVGSDGFGGTGTDFTMTGTSKYITNGGSYKPDAEGTYALDPNTTIEYANTSGEGIIRLTPTFAHLIVSGSRVNKAPGSGLKFHPTGSSFIVKNSGVFKFTETNGFTGSTNTAINNLLPPAITSLESGSTIDYAGSSQTITPFTNFPASTDDQFKSYSNLKLSGSGAKTVTATTEVLVGNNLTIDGTATLTLPTDKVMTVKNAINAANGASNIAIANAGSLVQINEATTNSVNTKIDMTRTTRTLRVEDYTYWSSPVSESGSQMPGTYDNTYSWTTDGTLNGHWDWFTGATPGVGFITRIADASASGTTFTGHPNNGLIDLQFANFAGGENETGNTFLLGNPYPSAIDAAKFVAANPDLNGALYFWTSITPMIDGQYNAADYATWNGTGSVAPNDTSGSNLLRPNGKIGAGQGFFTVSNITPSSTINVHFNNDMRVRTAGNNTLFFRTEAQGTPEPSRIWLNIKSDTAFRQTLVGYIDNATDGFDRIYDAYNFTGNEISLYSIIEDKPLVIQGRALPFNTDDQVPLGYWISTAGAYTIEIDSVEGLFSLDQNVYLEDKLLNVIHDLKESAYTFNTADGIFNDRFVLRYTTTALGIDPVATINDGVVIAKQKDQLKIQSKKEAIKNVVVFDLLGRKVFEQNDINAMTFAADAIVLNQQALIVKITLENGQVVDRKVIF